MTVTVPARPDPETDAKGQARSSNEPSARLGGYTRLVLSFEPATTTDWTRDYDAERRPGLYRWLMGKAISRILSIRATLTQPKVTTLTLALSIGRESNSKMGESWATEFNSNRVMTPYFRIDPESTVGIESNFALSSTYDASVAKAVLDVVRRGAKLVAPSTTLVTSLNNDRFDEATDFVDNSLASLLKESIVERASNDFALKSWAGSKLLTIELWAPIGNEITPKQHGGISPGRRDMRGRAGQQLINIGSWTVRTERPILSVFSDVAYSPPRSARSGRATTIPKTCADVSLQEACAAFHTLDPQTVLNFSVAENVSVAQALAGEQAIAGARDELMKSNDKTSAASARTLCTLVSDKAQRLGFNRFDVAAITWAYVSHSNLGAPGKALQSADNCAVLNIAYAAGLPRGEFADDKKAA